MIDGPERARAPGSPDELAAYAGLSVDRAEDLDAVGDQLETLLADVREWQGEHLGAADGGEHVRPVLIDQVRWGTPSRDT